jgi:hypothetical protein
LLDDDRFIALVIGSVEESEICWDKLQMDGFVQKRDYELAVYFIRSVQVHPEPILSFEIDNLWEDIEIKNKENLRKKKNHFRLYFSLSSGEAAMLAGMYVFNE